MRSASCRCATAGEDACYVAPHVPFVLVLPEPSLATRRQPSHSALSPSPHVLLDRSKQRRVARLQRRRRRNRPHRLAPGRSLHARRRPPHPRTRARSESLASPASPTSFPYPSAGRPASEPVLVVRARAALLMPASASCPFVVHLPCRLSLPPSLTCGRASCSCQAHLSAGPAAQRRGPKTEKSLVVRKSSVAVTELALPPRVRPRPRRARTPATRHRAKSNNSHVTTMVQYDIAHKHGSSTILHTVLR